MLISLLLFCTRRLCIFASVLMVVGWMSPREFIMVLKCLVCSYDVSSCSCGASPFGFRCK